MKKTMFTLLFVAFFALSGTGVAKAELITLDIGNLGTLADVGDYYNGGPGGYYGITVTHAVEMITAIIVGQPVEIPITVWLLNAECGFTDGFSYTSPYDTSVFMGVYGADGEISSVVTQGANGIEVSFTGAATYVKFLNPSVTSITFSNLYLPVPPPPSTPTPEPATALLVGVGLLGMLGIRKRFKK